MTSKYDHLLKIQKYDPDKTFFVSDTHFGHANIIKFCNRPFDNVDEMDREMIRRWNAVVPENGIVWHLGDIGKGNPYYLRSVIERLNGTKKLILGNHDRKKWLGQTIDQVLDQFDFVGHYAELQVGKQHIVVSHYPIESWNWARHKSWNLHGHCHGTVRARGLRMDVGVDGHPPDIQAVYTPWSFHEIARIMAKRKAVDVRGRS